MLSVRAKFLIVIALCLVPMGAATRVFYWLSRKDMHDDAMTQMKNAQSAFVLEFSDDIALLQVAARLVASDPDVSREVASQDRATLYEHIDDFSGVYRVYLTDAAGTILASSHKRDATGSLAKVPEAQSALAGQAFDGVTRLAVDEAPPGFYYTLFKPIRHENKTVGLLLAAFPLDRDYLLSSANKEGVDLSLSVGGEMITSRAGAPEEKMSPGRIDVHVLDDGRTLARISFPLDAIGKTPGPVVVTAAKDVTKPLADAERSLLHRMLVLLGVAVLALAAGHTSANPLVRAIAKIAKVLPGVALKKYERVEGIATGDELQALAETYNGMIAQLQHGERLQEALGKYLSRAARDAIEHGRLELGGTTLPATVLFSDIRGFTSLSEKMEPERVLRLLNRYFTEMVGAVVRHRGIVDKFIGDCIMAVWGPPAAQSDDALNAIRAALEMRDRLAKLNAKLSAEGVAEIHTGIGIHTGPVVAGNMGAASTADQDGKMEYTVIGDTVNLASRLESLTKELHVDIVMSEDTYRLVASEVEVEALPPIKVRGREQQVAIYRLVGLAQAKAQAS